MNQHSLFIVGILWVLVFLSQSTESSGWMPFSSSGSTVDSSTEKQPLQGSRDHDNVPAQFSMASYSEKGMKSVEEANRKIADLPNSCRQNAYNNLYANCSEILAVEEQQSRLAWDLTNCFLKGSATSLPECDLKSPMIECPERLKKSSPDDHIIYSQYYHVANSVCHHLQNDAFRRRTETLVNEHKSSGELAVNKLNSIDKKAEQLLDSSDHIDRSVSSINIQTQELAQTSKNVQERVNDELDQSLKISDPQMELQNSQTKMNERLDEGMTTLDESTNNLGKEMINLKNKAVEIEKEIVQAAEAVLTSMDGLQNKADDIKNKLDKQKQLVRSQTIALQVLQNAQEENRVAQQQLISLGHSQQQELIQGIEQLKKDHDNLAEKSKTILAALEIFESKQSNMFLAIEKLSTLHNAYVLEARQVKSFFLYFMIIIILHMLTSTRQTNRIRSRLYIELGVTLLIKIVVLRYGNDVEQQQWIIDNIRLLFIILASCQLMNAIYTYRDYDSLNHQMLQTLVDKVNKLRNKQLLYHNDDDGYNDDVDWSSWIDSDITEDELDDLEYVPPKGVPETSIITTSARNYNLRSRH